MSISFLIIIYIYISSSPPCFFLTLYFFLARSFSFPVSSPLHYLLIIILLILILFLKDKIIADTPILARVCSRGDPTRCVSDICATTMFAACLCSLNPFDIARQLKDYVRERVARH